MQTTTQFKKKGGSWKEKLLKKLRLNNKLTVKLYYGYGHEHQLTIFGHVLSFGPAVRRNFSSHFLINMFALTRLFIVKPVNCAKVKLTWREQVIISETGTDGFFRLNWRSNTPVSFGWHEVTVDLLGEDESVTTAASGFVFVPHITQYAFISDIDDTFLQSHSASPFKKLYVLFTNNARSRKPFEGVVKHYRLLALAQTKETEPNPFFYVSSSEWNLYEYIAEFIRANGLPKGVLLLNQLKLFAQLFKTGGNNHATKFNRIVRILEAFPNQQFILLGDSSQQDPHIYAAVIQHFPNRIKAVYIRDIRKKTEQTVQDVLLKLEADGVPCCFFKHSNEAIEHSRKIGLISNI